MDFTDWLEYKYNIAVEDDYDYYLARQAFIDWINQVDNNFIIGLNPRWQQYKFLTQNFNAMFSAAGYWDNKKKSWRRRKFFKQIAWKWLDCGGFTLLNKYGDYPFTVDNYANLQAMLKADHYATMDYPCEPEITRTLNLMSNRDRISATVENALQLQEWESQLSGVMVPVIQGYTLEEYEQCIDLYRHVDLIREYMAVGSMCRRIDTEELNQLIPGIYRAARRAGVHRLHFFGLKLSPDLQPLDLYIWSRDSAVAMDAYDPELRKERGGRRFPRGQEEKKEAFYSFMNRLDKLDLNYTKDQHGNLHNF